MTSLPFRRHPFQMMPAALIVLLISSFSSLYSQHSDSFGPPSLKAKLSPVLAARIAHAKARSGKSANRTLYPVIVQVDERLFESAIARSRSAGLAALNSLPSIHALTARLSREQIENLVRSDQIEYITLDLPIHPLSHENAYDDEDIAEAFDIYRHTIGAQGFSEPRRGKFTVAVFDSGIGYGNGDPLSGKVHVRADFTSGQPVISAASGNDAYGHGTHVAGIVDGVAQGSQHFVDVRVIGPQGWGRTSDLIRAVGWVVENKDRYHIRIANLSLGHPPVDSYLKDPLCQAVRRMVDAGIVTIVSAGNLGKTEKFPKIWGGVTSPGIEPSVITVGPVNNHGTLTHRDDTSTSYGSRGPTIDGFFKPDLVAPGNRIPSLLAEKSWIAQNYPELILESDDDFRMIELSGSSMATAFVSGAAVRMLQVNPELTPHLVKLILNLTAPALSER